MMAMIALAMKEDPVGVASGAILGHALATVLAVTIGSIACKYVSEKVVHIIRSAVLGLCVPNWSRGADCVTCACAHHLAVRDVQRGIAIVHYSLVCISC
jgi:hypothetical protein